MGRGAGAALLHEPITHTLSAVSPTAGMLHGLGWVCLSPRSKRGPTRALRATFLSLTKEGSPSLILGCY